MLGPTKTQRTAGRQLRAPTVVEDLRRREDQQADIEKIPTAWHDGEHLDLVLTTPTARSVRRQHVDRAIRAGASTAGLDPSGLGTHAGRRSVVTNLYACGSLDIADVAQFVGHSNVTTNRGYVQHQGGRLRQVSEKAFLLLRARLRTRTARTTVTGSPRGRMSVCARIRRSGMRPVGMFGVHPTQPDITKSLEAAEFRKC